MHVFHILPLVAQKLPAFWQPVFPAENSQVPYGGTFGGGRIWLHSDWGRCFTCWWWKKSGEKLPPPGGVQNPMKNGDNYHISTSDFFLWKVCHNIVPYELYVICLMHCGSFFARFEISRCWWIDNWFSYLVLGVIVLSFVQLCWLWLK